MDSCTHALRTLLSDRLPAHAIEPVLLLLGWTDGRRRRLREAAGEVEWSHECLRRWRRMALQGSWTLPDAVVQQVRATLEPHLPMTWDEALDRLEAAGICGRLAASGLPRLLALCGPTWHEIHPGWITPLGHHAVMPEMHAALEEQLGALGILDRAHIPQSRHWTLSVSLHPDVAVGEGAVWRVKPSLILVRRLARALGTCPELSMDRVQHVLEREPRFSRVPSQEALAEGLSRYDVFIVQDGRLRLREDAGLPPTPVEQRIVAVLRSGPCDVATLQQRLSMPIATLRTTLQISPVIARVACGTYAVLDTDLPLVRRRP